MRRSEREIKDMNAVASFLKEQEVIRLALSDEDGIYIVPVNYGMEFEEDKGREEYVVSKGREESDICFYFHGATEGRKACALRSMAEAGQNLVFEIDGEHSPVVGNGCNASYRYMCVMGSASIEILEGEDKLHGLECIMKSIMPEAGRDFDANVVDMTMVCRLRVKDWSCKKH